MNNKIALVTGASSGIGEATAERLAKAALLDAGIRKDMSLDALTGAGNS